MARAKRTHTNRTSKALYQPQSPAGKARTSKGKKANMGLADPLMPLWTEDPRRGAPKFLPRFGS